MELYQIASVSTFHLPAQTLSTHPSITCATTYTGEIYSKSLEALRGIPGPIAETRLNL